MVNCRWCGRAFKAGHSYLSCCSKKCAVEAEGSRSSSPSAPAEGGYQIDLITIFKDIASLFGKGKPKEDPEIIQAESVNPFTELFEQFESQVLENEKSAMDLKLLKAKTLDRIKSCDAKIAKFEAEMAAQKAGPTVPDRLRNPENAPENAPPSSSKKPASLPPGLTMVELQEMQSNIKELYKNVEPMKEQLANSRSADREEIERLKAKLDSLSRKQPNVNQGYKTDDFTNVANAGSVDILQQVEKLGEMLTKGYITQLEFDEKKADLLKRL